MGGRLHQKMTSDQSEKAVLKVTHQTVCEILVFVGAVLSADHGVDF